MYSVSVETKLNIENRIRWDEIQSRVALNNQLTKMYVIINDHCFLNKLTLYLAGFGMVFPRRVELSGVSRSKIKKLRSGNSAS